MFAYCDNNPVNYVDYAGEFPVGIAIKLGVVAATALAALAVVAFTTTTADAPPLTFPTPWILNT